MTKILRTVPEPTELSGNDLYVQQNIHRLPWWVTARKIDKSLDDPWGSCGDQLFWAVPEAHHVPTLKRGGKSHHGKTRAVPYDIFPSTTIRKAIERWGS